VLETMLRRRAYTPAQFEDLVAESAFRTCDIRKDGIGLEVRLRKSDFGGAAEDSNPKENNVEPVNRRRYEILMEALIRGAAAVIGIGGLYLLGLWVDHDL
jgi:hypothetical protein